MRMSYLIEWNKQTKQTKQANKLHTLYKMQFTSQYGKENKNRVEKWA